MPSTRLSRRALCGSASALVIAALAACSSTTAPTTLQTDAQLISSGLSGILTQLQAIPGVTIAPSTVAQIQSELAVIGQQAQQIGSLATPGSTAAQTLATAVSTVSALVTPFFPAAPLIAAAVQAAIVLAQGLTGAAGAALGKMTPDQARLVLKAAAVGR